MTHIVRTYQSRRHDTGAPARLQRAGRAELLTGIDGVSSRPVRRIVLMAG
jgi:hypothetical protein